MPVIFIIWQPAEQPGRKGAKTSFATFGPAVTGNNASSAARTRRFIDRQV